MDQPNIKPPWHALDRDEALQRVQAERNGLSSKEAARRLSQYGPNRLPPARRRSAWARFLAQFHNVLIYMLLAAALVTALLNHWVDTGVILAVVVINALVGFIQEGKAEQALDAIRNILSPKAAVLRDGHRLTVDASELVPGDIVLLQSGDKIPADLRLLQVKGLHIDESALTGESVAVHKQLDPVASEATIGDRTNLAFSGTLVTSGQGRGVVVGTGEDTEIGRISALLAEVKTVTTPLLRQITRFGQWLAIAIGALAVLLFAFGVLARNYGANDMFLASVGLAVAAIPEGLPAIITITLAIGVQRMAKRNAIIRLLPAVETLGSVTVACSDKTGTLTRNEMTVAAVATTAVQYQVTGVGYDPHGSFEADGKGIEPQDHGDLLELVRAGLLCNEASLYEQQGQWHMEGDPTEGALVNLALKAGLTPRTEAEERPRSDTIPFESEHRFMATLHHDHAGHGFIFVKGAPERVLKMCRAQRQQGEDHPVDMSYWWQQIDELAAHGYRLLVLASKPTDNEHRLLHFNDVESGLTLLGLVGIIDPPREEAIRAVADCRVAGIRVKMITGDHAATARAIGTQLGIGDGRRVLTGEDLDAMTPAELRHQAHEVDIFARVSPEHKLRLVEALQVNHEVVAMTGDGVNDAPALKRADVGVAMGVKGTEVAKEAADMVVGDDNFASIAQAVREGRTVYENIKKSIGFILPTNGGQALTIMAAIGLGTILPITPVQILWVNMVTAVTLALALAFDPPEADIMKRPPRDQDAPLLSAFLIWRIVFVSLILVAGTFGLFLWERGQGVPIEVARTVAVNTLVMFEVFYLFNTRHLTRSVLSWHSLFGNRYVPMAVVAVLVLQMLFTYAPPMQALFDTAPVDVAAWGRIVLVAASVFILVEMEKGIRQIWRRHHGRLQARANGTS